MNSKSGLKIVAALALLLNVVASFILFGYLKNLNNGLNQATLIYYVSIIAIIVFSFLLFLLFITSRYNEVEIENQTESNTEKKEEKDLIPIKSSPETIINLEELKNKAVNFIPDEKYTVQIFAEETLSQIAKFYPIVAGLFFLREKERDEFLPIGYYAYYSENKPSGFKLGETLPGQVAKNKKALNISDMPENYINIVSGLGKGNPGHLYFLPLIDNEKTIAIVELASFVEFDKEFETLFELVAVELSTALVQLDPWNL